MEITTNDPVAIATGVIGAISAVFAAYKVLDELLNGRYARLKQDIDYFDKLIVACKENDHPLKIEKLFECLYKKRARAEIICHFVNEWPSPSYAIWEFLRARELVQFTQNGFVYEGQLVKQWYRKVMKALHLTMYGIFFFMAWMPLLLQIDFTQFTVSKYMILFSYIGAMLIMSVNFLRYYWKVSIAEKLVNESNQLVEKSIIVPKETT